ncbi:MAG TPA: hypothetical protein VKR52_06620 [Terracidiphilus sp.]|nr:hypothetical protein [Terracidiphilus sp.]
MNAQELHSVADSPSVASSTTKKGAFERIFSRHTMNVAMLLMIPLLMAPTLNLARTFLVDPDIWWHLADARFLLTSHHFIHTDPYSFSVVGNRWIDWEWLGELPFWFGYKAFGLRGIYLLTWLALGANIIAVYWRGYLKSRHAGAALYAAALGFFLMTVNAGPRTIAFAYLAMSGELAILDAAERGKKRLLWLLPPLFCLWINLHGTWFIGLCLLVLYIACGWFGVQAGVFEQKPFDAADRNRLLTVLGVSIVALLLNPYGWRLMWSPLDMMLNQHQSTTSISEWMPLDLSSLEGKATIAAIAAMVIANMMRGRKWTPFEMATVFLAWYAAFSHHRFTYLAAVLTTPMLAADINRSFCIETDEKTIPAMNAVMVAASIGVALYIFPSQRALDSMLAKMFPLQSIASIQQSWRTLNWDYVGGRMDFDGKPTFIDSRFDSFEHSGGVLQDYDAVMALRNTPQLIDKYRIDHALLKDNLALAYELEHNPGWRVIRREPAWEGEYLLFEKTASTAPGATAPCVAEPTAHGR